MRTLSDRFEVVDGLESVRRRVLARLRFNLGEWYLRPGAGVPYLEGLSSGRDALSSLVKSHALSVADVESVEVEHASLVGRDLELRLRVGTRFGEVDVGLG